jgi:hypothetical protein
VRSLKQRVFDHDIEFASARGIVTDRRICGVTGSGRTDPLELFDAAVSGKPGIDSARSFSRAKRRAGGSIGTLHQRHISARTRGDSFGTPGHLQSLERKVGTTLNEKNEKASREVKGTGGEGGILLPPLLLSGCDAYTSVIITFDCAGY